MDASLQEYLDRLKAVYPTFIRFGEGDGELSSQERDYKLELVQLFQEELKEQLQNLPPDETSQSRIGKDLIAIFMRKLSHGTPQNLVGWRYWSPLRKLTASGKASFARLASDLLFGADPLAQRIDNFVGGLQELLSDSVTSGWAALSRSVTTFLLMLTDPGQHVIVKTQEFNRALKAFTGDGLVNTPLTGSEYLRIQSFLMALSQAMKEKGLSPRDLIDVQTLLWVGDPNAYQANANRKYWTLGAMWGDQDMAQAFVKESRWENGYQDKYLDKVRSVQVGDRVAIKTVYTQKYNLPFDNHGQTVSCMSIKAVGTVTGNPDDGRNLQVEWDDDFEPVTIYLYTYWKTIDRIDDKVPIPWIFDSVPQPFEYLESYYQKKAQQKEEGAEQALEPTDIADEDDVIVENIEPAIVGEPINRIYYGPPGCGKTYFLQHDLIPKYRNEDGARYSFITFHPSMSYEEFVEGLRPITDETTKELKYEVKSGIFREICKKARENPQQRHALFIDEINRANIAKVFGELITLIEVDKRVYRGNDGRGMQLTLPYSRTLFGVPANLDIYGTMNSADRSIALLDTALRRRFQFIEIGPDEDLLSEDVEGINLKGLLATLNERIELLLDRDHRLGHSFFIGVTDLDSLNRLFAENILPLLAEYFHDDWSQIGMVLINRELGKSEFVSTDEQDPGKIFGKGWDARGRRGREVFLRHRLQREYTKEMYLGLLT